MIAVKRLQSIFWVLLVTVGALLAYMVSLRAATERNELARVRMQIAMTRADVRYLETEFGARASLRQLERWNAQDFRYSTPTAAQYLNGERALASLDALKPNGPDYVAPPVMTAMVETAADLPSAPQSAPASPAVSQIRADISVIRSAQAADTVEHLAKPANVPTKAKLAALDAPRTVHDKASPGPVARNAERMAMLDSKLLDDRTLGDLSAAAASERKKVKR